MRNAIKKMFAGAALSLLMVAPAFAWDGSASAQITQTDNTSAAGAGGMGYRVWLYNVNAICGAGTPNWGYLDTTDVNYSVYVMRIEMAKAMSKSILVYMTKVGVYCHIGYLTIGV